MQLRRSFGRIFFDLPIWWRKEINLLIRIILTWTWPDTGSTRFLCVAKGSSNVLLRETFQELYSCWASSLNRSHMGEQVKCELKITFVWNLASSSCLYPFRCTCFRTYFLGGFFPSPKANDSHRVWFCVAPSHHSGMQYTSSFTLQD